MTDKTGPEERESKRLRQEALLQMRAARQRIAPELLEKARRLILERMAQEQAPAKGESEDVPVDRERNLSVVLRFLEMKGGTKSPALLEILSKLRH